MAELKVPTVAVPAEVLSTEGQTLVGRIFVPASSSRHSGTMRADEWLDEPVRFFPFLADGAARSVVLNKRHVLVLSMPQSEEPTEMDGAGTRRRVRIFCGERDFEGILVIDMPESQSRVLDYLNRPGIFLSLRDGARQLLIQKDRITHVQESVEG